MGQDEDITRKLIEMVWLCSCRLIGELVQPLTRSWAEFNPKLATGARVP